MLVFLIRRVILGSKEVGMLMFVRRRGILEKKEEVCLVYNFWYGGGVFWRVGIWFVLYVGVCLKEGNL